MAGRFARGLLAGLVIGTCVAGAVSLMALPPVAAKQPSAQDVQLERSYGPPASDLPHLRSDTTPPAAPVPQGDE
jgi:hypothetical protein